MMAFDFDDDEEDENAREDAHGAGNTYDCLLVCFIYYLITILIPIFRLSTALIRYPLSSSHHLNMIQIRYRQTSQHEQQKR